MEQYQHKLPISIADLQTDFEESFKHDKLNYWCNQPIPKAWLKKHPLLKTEYLPIDKVEYLMLRIFGRWRREIREVKQVANSIVAIVRVHAFNPITQEWDLWHDGVGAVPIQMDSGSDATNASAIKKNAIQIGAPAAVSFAVKDAAENFGSIFGKDLNKKDTQMFSGTFSESEAKDRILNDFNEGAKQLENKSSAELNNLTISTNF